MSSFAEKIKMFNTNPQSKKDNPRPEIKVKPGSLKDRIQMFNSSGQQKKPLNNENEVEEKIIKDSQIISDENSDMIIYKYPNKEFTSKEYSSCKILLFIGNNFTNFINSLINVYRDICYEDKFRYKIDDTNSNDLFNTYFIKARTVKYNLKIISIPKSFHNPELINDVINIFKNSKVNPKRINYIVFTLKEDEHLTGKDYNFFLGLLNLFGAENMQNKLMFLSSSNNSNNQNQINEEYVKNNFILHEYFKMSFLSLLNPEYFSINHNLIYDKSSEDSSEWKKMEDEIKKIQNKISMSKSSTFDKNKLPLYEDIFSCENKININTIKAFEKISNDEQIIFINFVFLFNMNLTLSSFILSLYEKFLLNKKEKEIKIKVNDTKISFAKNKYLINTFNILSKIQFRNLEHIVCKKCDLNDDSLDTLKNVFTKNPLQEIDLSFNKITKIDILFNCEFSELKKLNLSHNEISDISCLKDNLKCEKLVHLDLSDNKITKLNKIKLINLNCLKLLNNEISEGVLDFLNNFDFNIDKITIKK